MNRTDVIATEPALAGLEEAWWALWKRAPGATPFTSPAWLLPWWDAFHPGALRCIAVWEGEGLAAFLPLWLEDGPLGHRLLPLGIGLSDMFDVLVDPHVPGASAAMATALEGIEGWDRIELEELPEGAAAALLPSPRGCHDTVQPQNARPVLRLGEDPLASVRSVQRRKLRTARNRVARRAGTVEEAAKDTGGFLDDLIRLHGSRWTARGETGVLADGRVARFHAEALPALLAAGLARATRLRIEGRVAGAYYGLRHGGTEFAYLGGFDPAFAFESPGAVLIGHAIEAAHRDGARRFDFLRGQEAYKYAWGAEDEPNVRRSIVRHG